MSDAPGQQIVPDRGVWQPRISVDVGMLLAPREPTEGGRRLEQSASRPPCRSSTRLGPLATSRRSFACAPAAPCASRPAEAQVDFKQRCRRSARFVRRLLYQLYKWLAVGAVGAVVQEMPITTEQAMNPSTSHRQTPASTVRRGSASIGSRLPRFPLSFPLCFPRLCEGAHIRLASAISEPA